MNGTNTWQSANSNHPAEWDDLGCHDMNANGKADSVLFGNVTSEAGIHGAYIGSPAGIRSCGIRTNSERSAITAPAI